MTTISTKSYKMNKKTATVSRLKKNWSRSRT